MKEEQNTADIACRSPRKALGNCTAKKTTVCAELQEVGNRMDALKAQTKCIQALLEERQMESAVMKQELSKAKKSVSFSNVEYSALGFWVATAFGKS